MKKLSFVLCAFILAGCSIYPKPIEEVRDPKEKQQLTAVVKAKEKRADPTLPKPYRVEDLQKKR